MRPSAGMLVGAGFAVFAGTMVFLANPEYWAEIKSKFQEDVAVRACETAVVKILPFPALYHRDSTLVARYDHNVYLYFQNANVYGTPYSDSAQCNFQYVPATKTVAAFYEIREIVARDQSFTGNKAWLLTYHGPVVWQSRTALVPPRTDSP